MSEVIHLSEEELTARVGAYESKWPEFPEVYAEPDCDRGYSFDLLEDTLGAERFAELMDWMHGQTMMLCDGRRYDHDTAEYCETHPAHGPVVYTWDLQRFLEGRPVID